MNKSFDSSGAQFAWDSTSIKAAERCPRYYQYILLEGWQPVRKSVHLDFGGWYASALEHYHKHRALGVDREEAILRIVEEAMVETWLHERTDDGFRIPGTGQPWAPPAEAAGSARLKTRENLIRSLVWYFEELPEDNIETIILSNGKPAVEYSFSLPVDNDIVFAGHIDRFISYGSDPYVMDQKTTGSTITMKYFDDFALDSQMSMYTFAGKMIYNMPVKGVIIDAVQIAVGFSRFVRGFTTRSEDQLNEWYDETMGLIERTRKMTIERDLPRNTASCNNYGGCQFRGVCSKPREFRNQFLKADFDQRPTWDPLDRR